MKKISRSVKRLAFFLILILTFLSTLSGQAGNVPIASLPQFSGPFAIDGFLQRQSTSTGDWLAGPGGSDNIIFTNEGVPLIPLCVRIVDKYDSESDEVISKGRLQDDPNIVKWTLKKAMSKTDMNNILYLVALNPTDNHVWVVLGADKRTAGKNTSIDFEFLQHQVFMVGDINSVSNGGFISLGPHGGRTVGDLLISVSIQGSGSFSTIEFLQWQPGSTAGTYDYFPIAPPPGTAYGAANATAINVPFGAFGSSTYAPLTFAEAAVDVTFGFIKSVWIKSKSNNNFDDFSLPFQFTSSGFPISANYTFYDLYHAQFDVDISPLNSNDYNFHWSPVGAYTGTAVDPTVTGTLNDYNIQNPIFTADTNYNCIAYLYRVAITRKDNGLSAGETYVVINSPCKIGKPINPDQMHHGEALAEQNSNTSELISIFPNPARGASAIMLTGDNSAKDIVLIDINGAIIQRWSATNGNNLKLKELANGLYLLKITSKKTGNTITKKLVIEN